MLNLSEQAQIGIVSGAAGVLVLMVICMVCKLRRLNNTVYNDMPLKPKPSLQPQCSDCVIERHRDPNESLEIQSASFSQPSKKGTLKFTLIYQTEFNNLIIQVINGHEIVGRDFWDNAVDSYVQLKLDPDPGNVYKGKTSISRKTTEPYYNETFQFSIEMEKLADAILSLLVMEVDRYSRHHVIGQIDLELGDVVLANQMVAMEMEILEAYKSRLGLGDLLVSLSYMPTAERLSVVIMKARNLNPPFSEWSSQPRDISPFVKVVLLFDGQKVKKKKTSTRKQEKNPVYNESMLFDIPPHFLHRVILLISVADKPSDSRRSDIIGRVVIGSPSSGEALSHWNQMLVSPRRPIAAWHKLRL
ncbi:predicted protein [Nematostella vectensis]|uniref:C2 domain-containing protein n=1 Tax=Nematostella vectensis TaxID=45351 RepID=A7SX18_NEMVE|nr:synaptotagmin-6 [Nematostella vectensis]EDO31747.1 predicted protein [Nematostella vectensis]|eukprot:XP_001623847.1 predicted protein [Nematostella vectensis]